MSYTSMIIGTIYYWHVVCAFVDTNAEASKKKIVSDVFKKGDMWFRSGDLLKANNNGS
jgi:hypothetical protein